MPRTSQELLNQLPIGGSALAPEPVAVVRRGEVDRRTGRAKRHDAGGVYALLTAVIVTLDVLEVQRAGDAGLLVEVAQVVRQVRVVDNALQVALEVIVIDHV